MADLKQMDRLAILGYQSVLAIVPPYFSRESGYFHSTSEQLSSAVFVRFFNEEIVPWDTFMNTLNEGYRFFFSKALGPGRFVLLSKQ